LIILNDASEIGVLQMKAAAEGFSDSRRRWSLLTRGLAGVQSGEKVVLGSLKKVDCKSANTVIVEMIHEMIDPDQHRTFPRNLIRTLLLSKIDV
jgi:hypothetical protein